MAATELSTRPDEQVPGAPPDSPGAPPGSPGRARRERWGYAVWGFTGLVIVVPEIWAAVGSPGWPTISGTVGHLESLWSPLRILVVGLITAAAVQILTYPPGRRGDARLAGRRRWRTGNGRLTRKSNGASEEPAWAVAYFPAVAVVTAAAAAVAAGSGVHSYPLGYLLYAMIAVFVLIIPSVLAFWWGREVPYPTLYRTLADLERRAHPAATVILAGLAILAVHLVAFPWP
jgi:hypothetical protein